METRADYAQLVDAGRKAAGRPFFWKSKGMWFFKITGPDGKQRVAPGGGHVGKLLAIRAIGVYRLTAALEAAGLDAGERMLPLAIFKTRSHLNWEDVLYTTLHRPPSRLSKESTQAFFDTCMAQFDEALVRIRASGVFDKEPAFKAPDA